MLKDLSARTLFLASGSLAHNLSYFTSDNLVPENEVFDQKILGFISKGKGMDILEIDSRLTEIAQSEGGFRDLFMLMGAMGSQAPGKIKAYEKLPGVDMGVVEFTELKYSDKDEELLRLGKPCGILH